VIGSSCATVVIPCYNEVATVETVVRLALARAEVKEVVIVDDGSQDGTWSVLQSLGGDPRVKVVRHPENLGKGAALRSGFAEATAPIVIIQDADLEYSPDDYSSLLQPILQRNADVVFGSRFIGGGSHRVLYYWHFLGNRIITTFSNLCTNLNLTDIEVGYKAFRREIISQLNLRENGFGFEPEFTAKVSRLSGIRIYEVPVSYHGRTYADGKKIGWQDGIAAIWHIAKYNLFRY
jgi:glycosyltransferase involved in cell wall biosynthesis